MRPVVLVVDDSESLRRLTVLQVRRIPRDLEVLEAPDAESAGPLADRAVAEGRPLLVICDYRMPGKDGIAFAQELKSRHGGKSVRFVLFTASEALRSEERHASGPDVVAEKPMGLPQYRELLDGIVTGWLASF